MADKGLEFYIFVDNEAYWWCWDLNNYRYKHDTIIIFANQL